MTEQYEGIVNPPIDTLLEKVDSKYALVLFAAKRARQINAYYSQLHEGLFEYVGPLVDTQLNEKPLSISMREIEEDLLVSTPMSEEQVAAEAAGDFGFELDGTADAFGTDADLSDTGFSDVGFSAEGIGEDDAAVAEIIDTETAGSTEADTAEGTEGEPQA